MPTTATRRNGVDTTGLFATIGAVRDQPALAAFQFRATNRWVSGTHNHTTINAFYGAGQEQSRERDFDLDADHPAVLVGQDNGPTPVEYLLHALAACLASGLANIAAARGITLHEVTATVEGDIDLRGILGLDQNVRYGFERIRVTFAVSGDAPAEQLRDLVERSKTRSAVLDVITNGVPVSIEVTT
jgi:uncharacterized OsmC-like protein